MDMMKRLSRRGLVQAAAGLLAFIPAAKMLAVETNVAYANTCTCQALDHTDYHCEYCSQFQCSTQHSNWVDWYKTWNYTGACGAWCYWTYVCNDCVC